MNVDMIVPEPQSTRSGIVFTQIMGLGFYSSDISCMWVPNDQQKR
jgi:hypothetical protein